MVKRAHQTLDHGPFLSKTALSWLYILSIKLDVLLTLYTVFLFYGWWMWRNLIRNIHCYCLPYVASNYVAILVWIWYRYVFVTFNVHDILQSSIQTSKPVDYARIHASSIIAPRFSIPPSGGALLPQLTIWRRSQSAAWLSRHPKYIRNNPYKEFKTITKA